ncbi:MAG: hypothetical protein IJ814_02790 [Paludibacteraceae bacterium]|nr:hypothetical protein [Paludibacteraceae bacterium]
MQKKTIIIAAAVCLLGCIGTLQAFTALTQEQPQEIRGIIVDEHDSLWYETQQRLWLQQAEADPTNEHAWQQAFEAARYADMLAEDWGRTERKQAILDRMKEHIPNSFTYNLCMYMTEIAVHGGDPDPYAQQALRLMPDNIARKDIEVLISYLWMSGKTFADTEEQQQLTRFAQKLYQANAYPSYLLRYTYNSLQGMDADAIYFVNGDVPGYTSLVIQQALNLHTDKIIVPVSFLYVDAYRNALCNYLGIKDFEIAKDYASMDDYSQDLLEHIIRNSRRPVYFFPSGSYPETDAFKKNLYNEGLVFKYSTRRYNNMAVAKRNVETKYNLQYLSEPAFVCEEQWKGSERCQLNYMVMLAPVVRTYKEEGDTLHANRLTRALTSAVVNTSLPDEEKTKYINLLDDKQR